MPGSSCPAPFKRMTARGRSSRGSTDAAIHDSPGEARCGPRLPAAASPAAERPVRTRLELQAAALGLALAAGLVLCGASSALAVTAGSAAGGLLWLWRRMRDVQAAAVRLADRVRDLEVALDVGIAGGTSAAVDPAGALDEAADRVRRVAQRFGGRVQALEAQVAELERRNGETLASVRGRTSFMANLCHEIRTPLNGLLGFLSMLSETALDEQQREWVQIARSSGESLLALLNDVLDLAKMEAGKLTLERIEFDRDELFENVAGLFAPAAQARGVELLLDLEPSLPSRLLGDPVRLRQVLANLVGNAVKFTSQGVIELTVRGCDRAGSRIVLEFVVEDSGVGIPPDRLARLFAPFEQADDSTARQFGGTGLGLSIVKRLVEQMAGAVSVDSAVGRGTRFVVRVPLTVSGAADPPPVPQPVLVLLVDGYARRRAVLGRTLATLARDTATAADPVAALALVRAWAERPEPLVVLAEDGFAQHGELLAAVRHRVGSRLVALRSAAAAYDAVADGVSGVLVRPLRRAVLAAAIAGDAGGPRPRGAVPAAWSGKRVLLVEDNMVNQRLMCTMLVRLGIEVLVAGDGRQAVEACGRFSFDLILMDVQMPVMGGIEATRAIRGMHPGAARVPIIALTASAQVDDRDECLAAGMDDYLTKPVRTAALREMLARYIALAPAGAR
jgi:signal transduction histidine kinase/AmiR/NasT family two-component response regulator